MNAKETKLKYFGTTDVGQVRDHNEDSFVIIDLSEEEAHPMGTILMVADGMGGANAGEVASAIACKVIEERVLKLKQAPVSQRDIEKYLKNLILEAHQQIVLHANENPECEGMGTTAIIAWILKGHLHIAWCGDSRCYVYKKNQQYTLRPFSDDHSLVWQMVQNGQLSAEEARLHEQSNIILQVLGSTDSPPSPSYMNKSLEQGEKILLCSDGLNGMLSDASIQQILEDYEDVEKTTNTLIEAANHAGGTDNITVLFADVEVAGGNAFIGEGKNMYPKKKSKKWVFVVAFTLLLALLIFVFITWRSNESVNAETETSVKKVATSPHAFSEKAEDGDKTVDAEEQARPALHPNLPLDEDANHQEPSETNDYDFHTELVQLNEKLEKQIASTKKLLEGCNTCNDNPQLENVNEILSTTQDFIKNQINLVNRQLPIAGQSREQLSAISLAMHVPYDGSRKFEAGTSAEQAYMANTIDEVILKISEKLEGLTSEVQEKN